MDAQQEETQLLFSLLSKFILCNVVHRDSGPSQSFMSQSFSMVKLVFSLSKEFFKECALKRSESTLHILKTSPIPNFVNVSLLGLMLTTFDSVSRRMLLPELLELGDAMAELEGALSDAGKATTMTSPSPDWYFLLDLKCELSRLTGQLLGGSFNKSCLDDKRDILAKASNLRTLTLGLECSAEKAATIGIFSLSEDTQLKGFFKPFLCFLGDLAKCIPETLAESTIPFERRIHAIDTLIIRLLPRSEFNLTLEDVHAVANALTTFENVDFEGNDDILVSVTLLWSAVKRSSPSNAGEM